MDETKAKTEGGRKRVWTVAVGVVLVAILALYTFCFTVRAGTVGVVKTLGRISAVKEEPGIYAKWPWPFQTVVPVDVRTRLADVPGKEVLTEDRYNIVVTLAVGWRVADAATFLTRFPSAERAREQLVNRVADARERAIKQVRLNDIISTRPEQAERFRSFETAIRTTLREGLAAADYGIDVAFLRTKAIAFPQDVTQKIFERMTNERKRVSQDLRSKGENIAAEIRQNAELKKEKLLADAEAEARRIRGQGDAEAAKHYRVFKEHPELANFLRKCDALREILAKRSTVVLTPEEEPFTILRDEPPAAPGGAE